MGNGEEEVDRVSRCISIEKINLMNDSSVSWRESLNLLGLLGFKSNLKAFLFNLVILS